MSGFDPSDLAASVENGLQIAGFIQKNREKINKTYGRSAITGPPTKERAIAWEDFYKDLLEENGRHDIGQLDEKRVEKKDGSSSDIGLGQHKSHLSLHGSDSGESNANRDNKSRDVEGYNGQDNERGSGPCDPNGESSGVGNTDTKRADESQISTGLLESPTDDAGRMDDEKHQPIRRDTKRAGLTESSSDSLSVEELDSVLNEESALSSKRLKSYTKLKELSKKPDKPSNPIKKGTEERSLSMYSMEEPSSKNGATRDVHQSEKSRPGKNAGVDNVEIDAASVNLTYHPQPDDQIQLIKNKLDQVIMTQNKILEKLTFINEVKEEITNIKKGMHNFGLTLSTIEGYINSLMIVIPKSGVAEENDDKKVNPDLRMVIGRDKSRGLNDYDNKSIKIKNDRFGEDLFAVTEIDESAFLTPINKKKNHAAKFVPSNDKTSLVVVEELVKRKVKDESIRDKMLELIKLNAESMSVNDIYEEVKNALMSM